MAVSSSLSPSPSPYCSTKYEVFLSFRGEDTRAKFTSHLVKKLREKKIETYIDSDRLEKGAGISSAIFDAVCGSKISVVVFSSNYAASSWCLDEVVCVLECMKDRGQVVIPVFYEVDPSDVRKQSGSYEAAFEKLDERFESNTVNQWRAALTQVANLSGWHSQQYRTDSEFVEVIVKDIVWKLNGMSTCGDFKDLIGIDQSVADMENLLCIGSSDVRIIGIWGMGGLGKTTLARVLFEQLSSEFEGCCFLQSAREESQKLEGLEMLKKQLFSDLLEENGLNSITNFHEDRLRRKKVLVVLDDVDQPEQLDELAGDHTWFGHGSRVIITTRDYQVLRNRADGMYELKCLNFECSLALFELNAFKTNSLVRHNVELSRRVVNYAKGIPLALKVLGSVFRSRRRENWQIELDRLNKIPNKTVQNALKISYDGLDEQEQRVFLDIVCFAEAGEKTCRRYVERILGDEMSSNRDIDSLIDKSLLYDEENYLRMHDLVKEMGREIVRQQSIQPGKRSRLWTTEDCYHVLKNNTGTQIIEGISYYCYKAVELSPSVFNAMHMLRFLRIIDSAGEPIQQLDYLPCSLKYLYWRKWPFKSMPRNFNPCNLVELRLPRSNLERLWSGKQDLKNLKHVNLYGSRVLYDVSVLSQARSLESDDLSSCPSLYVVPSMRFGDPVKSSHVCGYNECSTYGHLNLSCCDNLTVLSSIYGCVIKLDLSWCLSLEELPSATLERLSRLEELDLSLCQKLKQLPTSICELKSLKRLSLNKCVALSFLPELPLSLEFVDACGCITLSTVSNSREILLQSKSWTNYYTTRCRMFLYCNTLLDQNSCIKIVKEFQLRVLRTAATIVSNKVKVEELGFPGIVLCLPVNKIPKWFSYRSRESTINIKLPSQWHNARFLGFALCVAFEHNNHSFFGGYEYLSCNLSFTMNEKKIQSFEWSLKDNYWNFGDMLMWYKYENYHDCHDAVTVLADFFSSHNDFKLTACGIRLLYREEYEEEFGISNVQ